MNNLIRITIALFLPFAIFLFSCKSGSRDEVTIKGRFTHTSHTKLLLFELLPDSTHIADSTTTDADGNFKLSIHPKEAGFYLIRRDAHNYITLAVNKGETIELEGDGKNLGKTYTVEGSEESSVLCEYEQFTSTNQAKVDSLSKLFKESQSLKNFPDIRKDLNSVFYLIFNQQHDQTVKLLKKNNTSIASLLIVNRSFGQKPVISLAGDFALFSAIDSVLLLKYPGNSQVITFDKEVTEFRSQFLASKKSNEKLQPGTEAQDISLPDVSGKLVKLSSLKGKTTLVYFWASWNAPCRKMNIDLAAVYEEFHTKGLEILGISLDPVKEEWIDAYRKDKANWIQLNDTAGLKSTVARNYKINSIPSALLIGKDGKVISGNVKTSDLRALIIGKL